MCRGSHQWEDDGQHFLLIRRRLDDPTKKTYYLVFAPKGSTLAEMVKAIGARWHIEEDFEAAKDLGLDHYQVRQWIGWYRHVTLCLLAHAFLSGICAQEKTRSSPTAPEVVSLPVRPLLPLTVPARSSLARAADLACCLQCEADPGLVLVATMPP